MTKHTLSYNIKQLEKGKYEALETWRRSDSRELECPTANQRGWGCADCLATFHEIPSDITHGPDCLKRGPCATYDPAIVDAIVDKVLALGPKVEKKPFVPFWAEVLEDRPYSTLLRINERVRIVGRTASGNWEAEDPHCGDIWNLKAKHFRRIDEEKKPFVPFKAIVLEDDPRGTYFKRGETVEIVGERNSCYLIPRHDDLGAYWVVLPEHVCRITVPPKPEPEKQKAFLVVHRKTKTLALVLEVHRIIGTGFHYRFTSDDIWYLAANYIRITDSTTEAQMFIGDAVANDNLDKALCGELET